MSTQAKVLRIDIFKKDAPRGIDRVIDYFGGAGRGRLLRFTRSDRTKAPRLRLLPASR
jgi:hypothetical protein